MRYSLSLRDVDELLVERGLMDPGGLRDIEPEHK
jgi:hypothetical protein